MKQHLNRLLAPCVGLVLAVFLWWLGAWCLSRSMPIAANLSPLRAFPELFALLGTNLIWEHTLTSLKRVLAGLGFALLVGVPAGILTGISMGFSRTTGTLFQFLRMISPLSWMPIAVMVLGVGDAPVYFLLAFAAVWPILLNTAAGVGQLDANWLLLARSLSATPWERLRRVILPAIAPHILTGVRLAIGVIWIVLVPAEMLGVSAGLGYFILDTRDRLAYHELMATILLIGFLGFLLDQLAKQLHNLWFNR
jgi:NitT/TauT family transport system permease protein